MNRFVFKLPKRKKHIFLSSKQFKVIRQIGSGGFAKVYLVKYLVDNQLYAMKKIEFSRISNWDQENVQKEIKIHKKLNSPYLVKMIDFFQEDRIVYIILEYCEKGDLYEFMRKRSRMPSDMIQSFFKDICYGIKYLHDNRIIMRDLKPENCLITHDDHIKICDLGWACSFNDEEHYLKLQAGSLPYMAPESLRADTATSKTDIWSLGIMLYELFFNKEPFLANSPETQLILIENSVLDFNPGFIIESAKELIEQCLQIDDRYRPSIEQLLESDYLNNKKQNYYSGLKQKPKVNRNRDQSTPVKRYVIEHSVSQEPKKKTSQKKWDQIITNDPEKLKQEKIIDKKEEQNQQQQQNKYYQIQKVQQPSQNNVQIENINRSKSLVKMSQQDENQVQQSQNINQIQKNLQNNFRIQNQEQNYQNTQIQNIENHSQNQQLSSRHNNLKNEEFLNRVENQQKQKSLVLENPHAQKIQLKKARTSYVGFQKHSKSQNVTETRRQSRIRIEDLSREKRIADQVIELLKTHTQPVQQKIPKYSVPYEKPMQHPVLKDLYKNQYTKTNTTSVNKFVVQNQPSDKHIKLYNEKKNRTIQQKPDNQKVLGYQQLMQNRTQKNMLMALPITGSQNKKYEKEVIKRNIYYKPQKDKIRSKSIQPVTNKTIFQNYNFNKQILNILNISGR